MSLPSGRRSSLINIDNWLDRCSDDEPDSMIYDPDFSNDVASLHKKQTEPELEALYKFVADICTKIGLPTSVCEERLGDINDCIITYYRDIQKDVQEEYDKLCQYKDDLLKQIQKMTNDLYMPPYVPETNVTLIQHCKKLKTRFSQLNVIKQKRMVRLQELKNKQAKHCSVLGIASPQVKLETDIPTEDELNKLAAAVLELEKEEVRRREKYNSLKQSIVKCLEETEYEPRDEFEQNIVNDKPNYSEDHMSRMGDFQKKLESLHQMNQDKFEKLSSKLNSLYDRLDTSLNERRDFFETHNVCKPSLMVEIEVEIERYEELKRQNIGKFIEKIKEELILEYERCYIPQEQQDAFFSLSTGSDSCSEELLELYEKEVERIRKYSEDNKEIFSRFSKWLGMWAELIELEKKANDPNRFNNRGGQLLIEEKQRKNLQKNLPKIEKEILSLGQKYSEANNGNKFQVFGTDVDKYIADIWDELNNAKEVQKQERQRAKMGSELNANKVRKPLQQQVIVKRTPTKRAAAAGITPTPSKIRCLGTPSAGSAYKTSRNLLSAATNSTKKLESAFQLAAKERDTSQGQSSIPRFNTGGVVTRRGQSSNLNGSDFSALSVSEQEFEEMVVARQTSAKKAR